MIFNILDNTTELWMTKYIIGEIFSSGGATLYKNHSDQTVILYGTYLSSKPLNPGYQLPDPSIIQTKKTPQIYILIIKIIFYRFLTITQSQLWLVASPIP